MEEEIQEIIDKFDEYMTKKGLDLNSKHNLSRYMTENYWEEIKGEDNELEEDDLGDDGEEDWLSELDNEEPEEEKDLLEEEPKQQKPNMMNLIKKSKAGIKKTKTVIKD